MRRTEAACSAVLGRGGSGGSGGSNSTSSTRVRAALDAHRGGVVPVVEPDEQLADRGARGGLRQPANHVLELAGRNLARAPAAVGVLRQAMRRHGYMLPVMMIAMVQGGVSGLVTGEVV